MAKYCCAGRNSRQSEKDAKTDLSLNGDTGLSSHGGMFNEEAKHFLWRYWQIYQVRRIFRLLRRAVVSDLGMVLGIFQVSFTKKQLSQRHGKILGEVLCRDRNWTQYLRVFSDSVIDLLLLGQHFRKGPGGKKRYLSTRYSREMYFKSQDLKCLPAFETKY